MYDSVNLCSSVCNTIIKKSKVFLVLSYKEMGPEVVEGAIKCMENALKTVFIYKKKMLKTSAILHVHNSNV